MAEERLSALELLHSVESEQRKAAALRDTFDHVLGTLWMAYQPIVHAVGGRLFGCEALLRSNDSRLPSPPAVLEAAEQLELLHPLGRTVRARAAEPFLAGCSDAVLFVNLHSRDLLDRDLFAPDAPLSRIAERVILETSWLARRSCAPWGSAWRLTISGPATRPCGRSRCWSPRW
jgi:EAL domain-containing protein (putative c-di-GMP-specific phosphodiesterase class I)